jgi:hypothetical protein
VSETPRAAWQTGAVLAVSGKTLQCLWKQTRKSVDAARAMEKAAAKPASNEPASAGTAEEKASTPPDSPVTDTTRASEAPADVPNGPDVGQVETPSEPPQ